MLHFFNNGKQAGNDKNAENQVKKINKKTLFISKLIG